MKGESDWRINGLKVHTYEVPTAGPEGDGTLDWNSTTMIVVFINSGSFEGIGYTYADGSTAYLISHLLAPFVLNKNAMDIPSIRREMYRTIRNSGRRGICSMAISAVDSALWDLKAKILNISLSQLLGQTVNSVPVYGSGGFTTYSIVQLQNQFSKWAEDGITMMKMKIGRDMEFDKKRIRAAREAIGNGNKLFIDANGAYNSREALEIAAFAAEYDVSWFEEPVSSDDLKGLRFVKTHAPSGMNITAGEYGYDTFYFRDMLEADCVDVIQIDATRCGGISGFLDNAVLSNAFFTPISAHTAPMIHIAPCCASEKILHIEYFYDHVRIENMFFDDPPQPVNGSLSPDQSAPGNGIIFRHKDAEKYRKS